MIKKIKKIKELALFSNYLWSNDLSNFGRYNLFYGWNGSGKTTLSKLFDSFNAGDCKEFENLEYEIETEEGNFKNEQQYQTKIRVFNKQYIDENIEIVNSKAKSIFILGAENKELVQKIEENERELDDLTKEKMEKEKEKERKETDKGKRFTDVAKLIGENLSGSSVRNYRKPEAEKDFNELQEKELLSDEELSKNKLILRQEQKDKLSKLDFSIDLDNEYKEVENLCSQTVESIIIEKLKNNQDISLWVEHGLKLHQKKGGDTCEFCNNKISKDRIIKLTSHFNEADKKLKNDLDSKILNLKSRLQNLKQISSADKARFYKDLHTKYIARVSTFNIEKNNLEIEINFLIKKSEEKKQKTTEEVIFEKALSNNFLESLEKLNEVIQSHNTNTDDFQIKKDVAFQKLKNHYLSEIFDEVKNLEKEFQNLIEEISKLENGNDKKKGIRQLELEINQGKAKVSSEHKACDKLNKNLETFLGRSEIIFEVTNQEEETGYVIKRNGKIAKNLSEGEKTAIAFVYFIVHLKDKNFKLNEGIVVIDDPISSLDSNSLFQAFAFLKNSVKDAKQVFLFTHNFSFLKLILNWLNKTSGSKYYMIKNRCSDDVRTAYISKLDKELEEHESEYHYLFKLLYEFKTDGSIASVYHIPNIARKVLETFLMFRVPNGDNFYKKLEILDFDEEKKTAIYKFTNDMSHITGDGFDPSLVPETQKNVQYLLEMMESVFPEHYNILETQFL